MEGGRGSLLSKTASMKTGRLIEGILQIPSTPRSRVSRRRGRGELDTEGGNRLRAQQRLDCASTEGSIRKVTGRKKKSLIR